ncbi:MAG TPA: MBL fold metallo-hydrolase [Desulfosalsimonadaceae bacterium]|nr:MBL fold metallo-hydrolase [Desulfosalsimonadaceae bacterium]
MQISDRLHAFLWNSMTSNNCNTYLIDGSVRILLDPGHIMHFDHVRRGLDGLGTGLDDIGLVVVTHAHPDHIEAVRLFKGRPAKIAMHEMAWQLIENFGPMIDPNMDVNALRPDVFLGEGKKEAGDTSLEVIHTPGHSPGSVSLYWKEKKALFSGDLIFRGGIGRTDIPGGDGAQLKASIRRVAELDIAMLLPGHGDVITGRDAVQKNFRQVADFWFAYV